MITAELVEPRTVTRTELMDLARSLGHDPRGVLSMLIEPRKVTVRTGRPHGSGVEVVYVHRVVNDL